MWSEFLIFILILCAVFLGFLMWLKYSKRVFSGGSSAMEIERRYFTFDEASVRSKLGKNQRKMLMRAVYFDPPENLTTVRIRQEGPDAFLVIKDNGRPYPIETETKVGDADIAIEILQKMGLNQSHTIEKIREVFDYNNAEVVIDHLPGLPPYIEIEASTETIMNETAEKLGLHDEPSMGVAAMYKKAYGVSPRDIAKTAQFTESDAIRVNREDYLRILAEQREMLKTL